MLFEILERVVDPQPHGAAFNMAMDETLLRRLKAPAIRIYRWSRPAVSFGYFEKYQAAMEEYPGREPVRRWTGGGIVPHGEDVTYSLFAPADSAAFRLKPVESYRLIHESIRDLLARQGVEGRVAAEPFPEESRACFQKAVRHDIVVGSRKIAGAAQRRTKCGLLHQGSIQNVELPGQFEELLAGAFSAGTREREMTCEELESASSLALEKYASDAWMRRY